MDEDKRTDWKPSGEIESPNRDEELLDRLGDIYWRKNYTKNGDPELFAGIARTILSQNQSDDLSGPAAQRITKTYGTGDEMVDALIEADQDEIADVMYPCGPHNQKAEWLQEWAHFVKDRFGTVDNLEWFVENNDPDRIREVLSQADGVGRKTIDVVLSFNAGKDGVFAVDTHVWRVAKRLAMVPAYASRNETADLLSQNVRPSITGWAHTVMIAFGRDVCTAQNPACGECPLQDDCPQIGVTTNSDEEDQQV